VNAEALMIASGQNVKRLVALGPRRPKKLEARDGGGPTSTREVATTPDPPTSHDLDVAFFNRLPPSTHSGE
jgi:hypothetical protein